jgi:hypothetical protein
VEWLDLLVFSEDGSPIWGMARDDETGWCKFGGRHLRLFGWTAGFGVYQTAWYALVEMMKI